MRRLRFAVTLALGFALVFARHAAAMPPIQHVFIIVLENKGFEETFGPSSPAVYLNQTLVPLGARLNQYYGIGHLSLDNYLAMVSGQAPNLETQGDCPIYSDFAGPADPLTGGPLVDPLTGQAIGQGCVFPTAVTTVVDQLEAKGLDWRAYLEDMGNDPTRDGTQPNADGLQACGHPALETPDGTQTATAGDQYAARHDPFVYFHRVIDDASRCGAHVVPLAALPADLPAADSSQNANRRAGRTPFSTHAALTPNYVFITPNLCNDAHDSSCADGRPGGLVAADAFLKTWVPQILASAAFQQDGLLIITFDEAEASPSSPSESDASSCCNEQPGPNSALPGTFGPGGGRTGAVLLSRYIRPCTKSDAAYNHYSMLRSLEDLFGVAHLGFAAQAGLVPFGADVYTNPAGTTTFGSVPGCSS